MRNPSSGSPGPSDPPIDLGALHGPPSGCDADSAHIALWREVEAYFAPKLAAYFRRWPQFASEVDDLVQETWARAYAKRRRFTGTGVFRAWLVKIAERVAIDRFRARTLPERIGFAAEVPLEDVADPIVDQASAAVELRETLERVPGRIGKVLELHLEGFTHAEIANELELASPEVSRTYLNRARRLLETLDRDRGAFATEQGERYD